MGAEPEVVVAGEIKQGPLGWAGLAIAWQQGGVGAGAERAQPPLPLPGHPAEGLLNRIERITGHAEGTARAVALAPLCSLGSP